MLIVHGDFWSHQYTFTHNGEKYVFNTIKDCRLFAVKNGYQGIKVEK